MSIRWLMAVLCLLVTTSAARVSAQMPDVSRRARTVEYHPRDLVAIGAKVHYTTMIVLPDGEDVVEATCGDKEFWIVNVRDHMVSVKPAKVGGETNLNLISTSGQIYGFLLTEVSAEKERVVDLTVYLEADSDATAPARPKFVSAEQVEDYRIQAELAREEARRVTETARTTLDSDLTAFRLAYPLALQFPYHFRTDAKPFYVRTMFHDDHRTFIQSGARELPAIYEFKDGKPNLVNFEVHGGTYVVPKILDGGYLTIGSARMEFRRQDAN